MNDEYLTPAEAGRRFKTAVGTLANWRSAGTGPEFVRTPSGRILYKATLFEQWIVGAAA